jgi:hypothetical protein
MLESPFVFMTLSLPVTTTSVISGVEYLNGDSLLDGEER